MHPTPSQDQAGQCRSRKDQAVETILAEYRKSGLTQRAFAEEAGMSVSTLQLWLRRVRRGAGQSARATRKSSAGPAVALIEVQCDGSVARSRGGARYEIRLGNGTRLRVASGFGDAEVRRLLGLLQEVR